ncbi:MAG: hypothetical protein H6807_14570 [Planctomycetes bacterium]|nr:hypothetical protein [Planctomycetota bacterium]
MSKRSFLILLTLVSLTVFGTEIGNAWQQDELEVADRKFEEHSYQPALEAYRKVLASEDRPADVLGHSALRVGLCLQRLQRWDEALKDLEGLEGRFKGLVWEARLRMLRGNINLTMPHYYYQKGEEFSRTRWIQGATYHYTYYDDLIAALRLLESAWELWQPQLPWSVPALEKAEATRRAEEVGQLGLALASALEAHREQKGGLVGFTPHPDVIADLQAKVPALAKEDRADPQTWFAAVESVSLKAELPDQAAMARYLEAMYCNRLLEGQRETKVVHRRGETVVSCRIDQDEVEARYVQLPDRSNPFRLLKALIENYPKSSMIDVATFVLAKLQENAQLYVQALETTENYAERFPESVWRSDVLNLRQEIVFPRLSCENPAPVRPGRKVELELQLRNIDKIEVRARRFDLGRVMASARYLRDDELDLRDLSRIVDRIVGPEDETIMTLASATPDEGKHLQHTMKVDFDLPGKGAYLVEVLGGECRYVVMALVSDLAMIRKTGDRETIVYVADAATGAPAAGTEVTVRQKHRARGLFGRYDKMTWDSGTADDEGLFRRSHEDSAGNSIYIEAFARRGEDYAVTMQSWSPSVASETENAVVYGFTDRPVYRPSETIGWVANLRSRKGENYVNLPDEDYQVTVVDPKGNKIFDRSLTTDGYGTIEGSLAVGAEPPLGTYYIQYRRNRRYLGGHSFRIEEYKKPEFEVVVEGPDEPVRSGDLVPVTVKGIYYFGAPVAEAAVAYRVYREPYSPAFNLREPYAWLYGKRKGRSDRWSRGARELVMQGEGKTDENGLLALSISSADWKERYPDQDHRFVIEADMTDLSRRTISGQAAVVVPRRGLFAHVEPNRGFYRAGETATFELRTQTPDGVGVASSGQITVFRVRARRDGETIIEERSQVQSAPATTARNGLGSFQWQCDAPGRFVVQYVTQDRWAEPVQGEVAVWVTDTGYRADDFQFKNLELITDRAEYQPGDTAFIMLNSVFPASHVLVTVEADSRIISCRLMEIVGKTAVMSLEIPESYAPNVYVHATTIQDGGFYESVSELFVPPSHRFIDVGMKFDKPSYQPGEMAHLDIEARDNAGEPLAARFALRVMDRAITYIQDDETADIRKFFYGSRRGFQGSDSWNSNTRNSQQFSFAGYMARQPEWVNHDSHGMPQGFWLDLDLTQSLYGGLSWSGDVDKGGEQGGRRRFFDDGFIAGGDRASGDEAEMLDSEDGRAEGKELRRARRGLMEASAAPSPGAPGKKMAEESITKDHGEEMVAPEMRENFSDLATWQPSIITGANGKTSLEFRFPDSLTDWEATLRGITADTRVGMAEATVKTVKNVLVRLQAPRFFTEMDRVLLSTLVRNDFDQALDADVDLAIEGGTIALEEVGPRRVRLEPGRELRIDWPARVLKGGEALITAKVLTERESDAMQVRFPVFTYGITKTVTRAVVLEGEDGKASFPLVVPAERKQQDSRLELTMTPSMAATLLESLPYLIEYPYGCTEQTMSRFMPAVVVARALADMGTSLDEIKARRQDLENRDLLNARKLAPVYSDADLRGMLAAGLRRLESMQNSDGGFGWWRLDRSSVHLTSYVLQGLAEARLAGQDLPDAMINRAADWLEGRLDKMEDIHEKTYAAFALARAGRKPAAALDQVFKRRDRLGTQGKAQLAIALQACGRAEQATLVLTNLEDFVRRDEVNGIAWWDGGASWWRWYDDEVETNAWVLLAMTEVAPQHRFSRPLARWLIYNRSGNRWKSTRDTALSVLALARHAKAAGELDPDYEIVVRWGDRILKRQKVDAANMFAFDNRIVVEGDAIETGPLPLVVERVGRGPLYLNCRLSYFSREDRIAAAGDQVELRREYYLLKPIEKEVERGGRKIKILDYERSRLDHMARVRAGDQIEVKLFVTAANNYEYIMLEDRKPSGFEPVELRSGGRYGNGLCSNMELRDEKVVFFVTWLQKGTHEISYRMRAEVPGLINAMPGRAEAMYAPKLGGISDSWRVEVADQAN